jgi:hypothetical protein
VHVQILAHLRSQHACPFGWRGVPGEAHAGIITSVIAEQNLVWSVCLLLQSADTTLMWSVPCMDDRKHAALRRRPVVFVLSCCREYEAARRRTLYHRAWDWVMKQLSTVPQSISWGLLPGPDFHFVQKQPQHEQQHLLAAHTTEQPSDKHSLELPQVQRVAAGTALRSSIAGAGSVAAGNTSGGASVPSRGQGSRGQVSSCATSSEGIGGGATGGMLGRISMASHVSHMSQVADMQCMDPDDLLLSAEDKLEAARQQVRGDARSCGWWCAWPDVEDVCSGTVTTNRAHASTCRHLQMCCHGAHFWL